MLTNVFHHNKDASLNSHDQGKSDLTVVLLYLAGVQRRDGMNGRNRLIIGSIIWCEWRGMKRSDSVMTLV